MSKVHANETFRTVHYRCSRRSGAVSPDLTGVPEVDRTALDGADRALAYTAEIDPRYMWCLGMGIHESELLPALRVSHGSGSVLVSVCAHCVTRASSVLGEMWTSVYAAGTVEFVTGGDAS